MIGAGQQLATLLITSDCFYYVLFPVLASQMDTKTETDTLSEMIDTLGQVVRQNKTSEDVTVVCEKL